MNLEKIEDVLTDALPLRCPTFPPGERPKVKVNALEDHILRTAFIGGELVEAKHWLLALEGRLSDEWATLEGWEANLRGSRTRASKADIDRAKKQAAPALYEAGRKARRLRESVIDQIARMEREERVVSRAYTMVTGG